MNKDTFILMSKDISPFTYWRSYATKKVYQLIEMDNESEKGVLKSMITNEPFKIMKYDLITQYEKVEL